jgi:hypothetical protein
MWKVVYDIKCGAIVMLSVLTENGMVQLTLWPPVFRDPL